MATWVDRCSSSTGTEVFRGLATRVQGGSGHAVTGAAGTVAEALARAGELRPDTVQELSGLGLRQRIERG